MAQLAEVCIRQLEAVKERMQKLPDGHPER